MIVNVLKLLIKMQIKDKSHIYDNEEQLIITIVKDLVSWRGNDTRLTSINSVVVIDNNLSSNCSGVS